MNRIHIICLSLLLLTGFSAGAQLTVFPGDCNNNGICNNVDLLYIGIGFNVTGPPRGPGQQNILWSPVGYSGVQPWFLTTPTGINYGHIDCDGNGSIGNAQDVQAIDQNYSFTGGTVTGDVYAMGANGDPILGLQINNNVVSATDTAYIDVVVGSQNNPVDSLYGLAFSLYFDTTLVDTVFADFRNGWMVTGGFALLEIVKVFPDSGRIDVAISRFDGANAAGFGVIGSVGIAMDDNLKKAVTMEELELRFDRVMGITRSETKIPLWAQTDTLFVLAGREPALPQSSVQLFPNPATDLLYIDAGLRRIETLTVFNATGQILSEASGHGQYNLKLSLNDFQPGLHWVQIRTDSGTLTKKLVILSHQ